MSNTPENLIHNERINSHHVLQELTAPMRRRSTASSASRCSWVRAEVPWLYCFDCLLLGAVAAPAALTTDKGGKPNIKS
jgi:hypothetical protein